METIGRIRRERLVKGKSIKEIARDLKVSRNTVRKVLRSGETSFAYQREVQPRPKLGRWKNKLEEILEVNAKRPSRERLTLIRVFEALRELGYEGGYDEVRRPRRSSYNPDALPERTLNEVRLLEISLCPLPASKGTSAALAEGTA